MNTFTEKELILSLMYGGVSDAKAIWKLIIAFGSLQNAAAQTSATLRAAGITSRTASKVSAALRASHRHNIDDMLRHQMYSTIAYDEASYPTLLTQIPFPPPLLFTWGNTTLLKSPAVAVVGTRNCTRYGKVVTERIVRGLVENGITIVSGLAYGVDIHAHRAALEGGGGTIAVLGSGFRHIYPPAHRHTATHIIEKNGLVLSEFLPDMPPLAHHFPQRNRVISGLSLGTLVTEAAVKSGSLITAYAALEQNREVFAVPGNITSPLSSGTNDLIARGARLVRSAEDILTTLHVTARKKTIEIKNFSLSVHEQQVYDSCADETTDIDKLLQMTKLDISIVTAALTQLELKGLLTTVDGRHFIKVFP